MAMPDVPQPLPLPPDLACCSPGEEPLTRHMSRRVKARTRRVVVAHTLSRVVAATPVTSAVAGESRAEVVVLASLAAAAAVASAANTAATTRIRLAEQAVATAQLQAGIVTQAPPLYAPASRRPNQPRPRHYVLGSLPCIALCCIAPCAVHGSRSPPPTPKIGSVGACAAYISLLALA